MHLRLVLATIVAAALTASPCLARDSHAQHGGRANANNKAAVGKSTAGASSTPNKPGTPLDSEATVAPPVLPPHGAKQQQIRIANPSVRAIGPGNVSRGQTGATTMTTPLAHNAIGQPVAPSTSPALQRPGVVSLPLTRGAPATTPTLSGTARISLVNANRGGINGANVIRPATGPSGIGGPAQPRYGINGSTVQIRH